MSGDAEKFVRLGSLLDVYLAKATAAFYAEEDERVLLEIEAREAASNPAEPQP